MACVGFLNFYEFAFYQMYDFTNDSFWSDTEVKMDTLVLHPNDVQGEFYKEIRNWRLEFVPTWFNTTST